MTINRKTFFAGIRTGGPFNSLTQKQVDGIGAILDEWERRKLDDPRWLAYMLATTKWETASTMQPIKEYGGFAYLKSKRYYPWYGRGFVQLTWKANYAKFRQRVIDGCGVDIIADPDALLGNIRAACIVMFDGMIGGEFTGKKLGDYFNAKVSDWKNARRIINGVDHANDIAVIAKQFYADIVAAGA